MDQSILLHRANVARIHLYYTIFYLASRYSQKQRKRREAFVLPLVIVCPWYTDMNGKERMKTEMGHVNETDKNLKGHPPLQTET